MALFNSNNFKHITISTYSYCLLQLMSTLPIYFILKPELNQHSANLCSASSLIKVTLPIYNMAQSKVNRELGNLGVSHTNVLMNKCYATQNKLRIKSPLHGVGKNNFLPSWNIINNQSFEASASATNRTSLLSPTNNNPIGTNIS